jgi:hypothetical protein
MARYSSKNWTSNFIIFGIYEANVVFGALERMTTFGASAFLRLSQQEWIFLFYLEYSNEIRCTV